MKKFILSVLLNCSFLILAFPQDSMNAAMEKRAKELHRVLGLADKEEWKKFMKENYTATFLEKPMKSSTQTSTTKDTQPTKTEASANTLDQKSQMFQRLHDDFGKSKILTLTPSDEKIEMVLENTAGLRANIELKVEKKKPYLIEGLRIQVN